MNSPSYPVLMSAFAKFYSIANDGIQKFKKRVKWCHDQYIASKS